jgi:RNA recognition motif-containing protein
VILEAWGWSPSPSTTEERRSKVSCKVFVGNLPWKTTSDDLAAILRDMGHDCRGVRVVTERDTGRSRGFAFVEVDTQQAVQDVVRDLDGHVVDGRPLRVNEAEDKPRRSGSGGRGGGGGKARRGGSSRDGFEVWDD